MENASKNASDVAAALLEERHGMVQNAPVLIVCGSGNNAGDGFAMARHLTIAGARVRVLALTPMEVLKGDALVMARITRAMEVPIEDAGESAIAALARAISPRPSLIIDAIFGTGLSRVVDGMAADVINAINASNIPVLAIDVPSGLNADTGVPMGVAIRATATVTMAGLKPGLVRLEAQEFVGDLSVVDIGVPGDFAADLGTILDIEDAQADDAEDDDPDFGSDSDRSRERL
jgi:NAD(P)H-hydrate epimerase